MKWMVLRLWENVSKFQDRLMMDLIIEVMEEAVEVADQEAEVHNEAEEVAKDHIEHHTQLLLRIYPVVAIGHSSRIL